MRLPETLLALTLAAASPSARAAEEPDALAAAVHHPGQLQVLRENHLQRPPNLRAYGLTLDADGVYRAVLPPPNSPPGTARKTATSEQFATALARWEMSAHAGGPGQAGVLPSPPDAAAAARQAELARRTETNLHDAAGALAAGTRFDDAFAPLASAQNGTLSRGLPRSGADGRAGGAPPPTAATASAWAHWTSAQIDAELVALNHGSDEAIEARRAELIVLASGGGVGTESSTAIHVLGRLHDETLLTVFLPALRRANSDDNFQAAYAVSAIVANYKAKESGWDAFVSKGPPLIGEMLKAAPQWNYGLTVLKALDTDLNLINLMDEADVNRFLAGFDDPRALLMMLSLGDTRQIGREAGIHSDAAALIYARYRQLSPDGASTLGVFLEDPSMSLSTRGELLDRLNRYRLIAPELERDEILRRDLPLFLFGKGSLVPPQTVFSIGALAVQDKKADFAKNTMDFIRASSEADARPAVAFLLLHPQALSAAQLGELKSRFGGLAAKIQKSMASYRGTPPVYDHWPKDKTVNAALLMVDQQGQIQLFAQRLKSLGYAVEPGPGGVLRFMQSGANGQVRLTLFPFAADNTPKNPKEKGWAVDSAAVQAAVIARLSDPNYQVVVYRGHVGDEVQIGHEDEDGNELPAEKPPSFAGKVFVDLACDSEGEVTSLLQDCKDCAFFGTNQTAQGIVNNVFLPDVLSALASRQSFAEMNARFQASMPRTFSRFTGDWSPAKIWADAAGR